MPPMQWLFDIVIAQMEAAGFIRIGDVETYLKGMIVLWSGDETDVPAGWAICDGTLGTPNLTTRFILGWVGPGSAHGTGGAMGHTHDFTGDGHPHHLPAGSEVQSGVGWGKTTAPESAVGTTDGANHVPPFYVLCYIMKL